MCFRVLIIGTEHPTLPPSDRSIDRLIDLSRAFLMGIILVFRIVHNDVYILEFMNHTKVAEMQSSHTAEKVKQAKSYKRQLKDLGEQLTLMKRKEHEKAKLESLMRKSEDLVNRLKTDVSRIKGQKAGLVKQVRTFAGWAEYFLGIRRY
jgi:hypothetical protein